MRARLGQNFLYQTDWQRRVAGAIAPGGGDRVLEIGGGEGHLTALLAATAERVRVVEMDPRLAAGLRERFARQPNVEVVEADILSRDWGGFDRVAGNLPYYITTPILLRLFHQGGLWRDATFMMQKEVAERVLAQPGSRAFGLLTATVRLYSRPAKLFDLPPGAFRPPPKVHSTLVRLESAPRAAALGVEAAGLERFLRTAFQQKRKQLANALAGLGSGAVLRAMAGVPIGRHARAEDLSLEQLAALYRALRDG